MSKIVVLDGHAMNPGDLSWDALAARGELEVFDRSTAGDVVARAAGAEIVLTNKAPLSRDAIQSLPALKYIGVMATGYNVVDLDAARERKIAVTNVPVYSTSSVAQMVFAHLLNLAQPVAHHAAAVSAGRWSSATDWCFWDTPLIELEGRTLGIIGLGRIGRATAKIGDAFGMRVIAATRSAIDVPDHIERTDIETVFRESDVVSLHCPLTEETEGMVSRERLAMMRPTAFLINTSRGPLVDEVALSEALNGGRLAGAALDVLSVEPPAEGGPLIGARNCQITPHIAWATLAARQRLMDTVVQNVVAFQAGKPQNLV